MTEERLDDLAAPQDTLRGWHREGLLSHKRQEPGSQLSCRHLRKRRHVTAQHSVQYGDGGRSITVLVDRGPHEFTDRCKLLPLPHGREVAAYPVQLQRQFVRRDAQCVRVYLGLTK